MGERTYTGWKAGLLVVFATIVLFSALNLLVRAWQDDDTPHRPPKVVTTVSP